jgi:hypothetical protein
MNEAHLLFAISLSVAVWAQHAPEANLSRMRGFWSSKRIFAALRAFNSAFILEGSEVTRVLAGYVLAGWGFLRMRDDGKRSSF